MIPRFAALSSAEISPRICSAFGLAVPRADFCRVRNRVRTPRFWTARESDWRERFAADFVLAISLNRATTVAQTVKMSRCRSYRRPERATKRDLTARAGRDLDLGFLIFS